MENITIEEECDCPMECNSVSYTFSLVSTPFDPEKMCLSDDAVADFLMKEYYEHKEPPQFVRRLIEFESNVSSRETNYCKKNIHYRAEVEFILATNSMSVKVISRRLSFFDKMSAFGKSHKVYLLTLLIEISSLQEGFLASSQESVF